MSKHQARKRFGQHFLIDEQTIGLLVRCINPLAGENLIEIGPGQGVLTRELLAHGANLIAIEIDRDLIRLLKSAFSGNKNFQLIEADALTIALNELGDSQPIRVVGNLPYNISTPLLISFFKQLPAISEMIFMLQKEFVSRMCAEAGSREYGRLSILTQTHCIAEELFDVPPTAFSPAPKVDSAVVRLTPLNRQLDHTTREMLAKVSQLAFSQRRKMIKRSLRDVCDESILIELDINPHARPETIEIGAFLRLASALVART